VGSNPTLSANLLKMVEKSDKALVFD